MSYVDVLRDAKDLVTPGLSACQGCSAELILRTVLKLAGEHSICGIPAGCLSGTGAIGWNYSTGLKIPVTMPLLDNSAAYMSGISQIYHYRGRGDVNVLAVAGDGATADCGFQSLSAAAERNERLLYVCYDNEGYMNTGYQRSSTTNMGSATSTTPRGSVINGKRQSQKYVPLIIAMHNVEYCATVSSSNMADFVSKVQKGLAASKRGFAYIHAISPCPSGWRFPGSKSVDVARKAVACNLFPLWEFENGRYSLTKNRRPIKVAEFLDSMGKFKNMDAADIETLQVAVDARYSMLERLAEK